MKFVKTSAAIAAIAVTSACVVPGYTPGSSVVTESRFDDRRSLRTEPGWITRIGGSDGNPFSHSPAKIGALFTSQDGVFLVARVEGIARITGLEVKVEGRVLDLRKRDLTRFHVEDPDGDFYSTHSRAYFSVDPNLLERMTNPTGPVLIRVSTSEGYIEGDFASGCSSKWPDRACVGIRKALSEAKSMNLI